MIATPGLIALIVGIIVWGVSASLLWGAIAAIIVLLLVGGGVYSRRL